MNIITNGMAGSVESNDALITVEPYDNGIDINLNSAVQKQFGKQILKLVNEVLNDMDVKNAKITIVDKGAINYVLDARLRSAIYRAAKEDYKWEA